MYQTWLRTVESYVAPLNIVVAVSTTTSGDSVGRGRMATLTNGFDFQHEISC